MEINITKFFNEAAPMDYFASVAEIGVNAGRDTWNAAKDDAGFFKMLDTREKLQAFIDHVRGFGAWSDEEMKAWTVRDANAIFIQLVSGDMREAGLHAGMADDDWQEYERDENISYTIYRGIDGEIYYCLGS